MTWNMQCWRIATTSLTVRECTGEEQYVCACMSHACACHVHVACMSHACTVCMCVCIAKDCIVVNFNPGSFGAVTN